MINFKSFSEIITNFDINFDIFVVKESNKQGTNDDDDSLRNEDDFKNEDKLEN